ncbi:homeobox protein onecut [Teleopsis dalmanni]|uniref:homeobox protein onecut n=1 Tax=Teleopsis dalmanni TaxID=139649 RepID=UPI0018CFA924|nr:homeobox protein onecut [Teleopsis dalmanni]
MPEDNDLSHKVITGRNQMIETTDKGKMVMVRTILEDISQTAIHSNAYRHQTNNPEHLFTSNDHNQHHNDHIMHEHPLHGAESPTVDFITSEVTFDTLSADSSNISNTLHIIDVKQENNKYVVINNNHNSDLHSCIEVPSIGIMNKMSSDTVEVTLNQHHHIQQQQDQLQYKHHYINQHQSIIARNHIQQQNSIINQRQSHNSRSLQHSSSHQEPLSVIVQPHDDSHDSSTQILSPELGVVGVVGCGSSLSEPSTYQTLTSVNQRLQSPGFSPTSSYATLTPLQPLPPISTMSEKFAYRGHINGSTVINGNIGNESSSNSSSGAVPFSVMTHQNSLVGLNLSSLSGEQSPYSSSFDKLTSMDIPMSPSHNYATSPTNTLSGMVVSCDLPPTSPVGCEALSPQSAYSPAIELHSPTSSRCKTNTYKNKSVQLLQQVSDKHIVCLSPVEVCDSSISNENIVVTAYQSTYDSHQREIMISTTPSSNTDTNRLRSHQLLHNSPTLSPHAISLNSASLQSPTNCNIINRPVLKLQSLNNGSTSSLNNICENIVEVSASQQNPTIVSMSPCPSPSNDNITVKKMALDMHGIENDKICAQSHVTINDLSCENNSSENRSHQQIKLSSKLDECNINTNGMQSHNTNIDCNIQKCNLDDHKIDQYPQINNNNGTINESLNGSNNCSEMEEINTKELAQRISAELKRYSIPQAIFAQRVLCRSQGTLSDLLRNPKPWSKLKSGRETFRRMFKWLQEPEFQRMSALRMAAAQIPQRGNPGTINSGPIITNTTVCRRKDEPHIEHMSHPKKPRLVFTDLQRRTLQAIFKETKRPSKEMQVTIARQLGLEPTTVGNFFMNARRRSMDKWRDDDSKQNMNNSSNGSGSKDRSHSTLSSCNPHSLGIDDDMDLGDFTTDDCFDDDDEIDDEENNDLL